MEKNREAVPHPLPSKSQASDHLEEVTTTSALCPEPTPMSSPEERFANWGTD
jgi:hypothetical protein